VFLEPPHSKPFQDLSFQANTIHHDSFPNRFVIPIHSNIFLSKHLSHSNVQICLYSPRHCFKVPRRSFKPSSSAQQASTGCFHRQSLTLGKTLFLEPPFQPFPRYSIPSKRNAFPTFSKYVIARYYKHTSFQLQATSDIPMFKYYYILPGTLEDAVHQLRCTTTNCEDLFEKVEYVLL